MSSRVGVELWVKAEPFSYGALPVAPHPRLNFTVSEIFACNIMCLGCREGENLEI